MKRRDFIHINIAALGGVLINNHFSYAQAMEEISQSFQYVTEQSGYDLIINGAGLSGCFAAIEASRQGMKVLVIDKRTSPGYDITAKRKLWLNTAGYEKWPDNLVQLFFPEGEKKEIFNNQLGTPYNSSIENETLLFAGSLKKGLLRSLLTNNIDLLLMTDVCGIISDQKRQVSGIIVACKQGVYSIPTTRFIDASDNNSFTRRLFGQSYKPSKAGFVIEIQDAEYLNAKYLPLSSSYGLSDNRLEIHHGKKSQDQYFLSFNFPVETDNLSAIEQKARIIATQISKDFPLLAKGLANAKLRYHAQECSYYLDDYKLPNITLKDYICIESRPIEHSYNSILELIQNAQDIIGKYKKKDTQKAMDIVYYTGGKSKPFNTSTNQTVNECGYTLPLTAYPIKDMQLPVINNNLLIAGGGTAGTAAALSAAEKGAKPLIIEYFNDLGGSKTMGGVTGYYLGQNKHSYILALEKEIRQTAKDYNIAVNCICRCFHSVRTLNRYDYSMINGAIICGAQTNGKKLEKVAICVDGELKWIQAKLTVDATGDGDIAYFAGENFEIGNTRMYMTQNYSQWDLPFKSKNAPMQTINKDYDIIDNTKITELQRGLYLSHYESFFYDFYPMLTVRESRRPEGEYKLNLIDALEKIWFKDTIINAHSDFDPHHFGHSEYSRCAFLLPHSNQITVNIPYRSIVPKTIDGLLLSGRGISQTHNALQFTRMSADVYLLGYATGIIAASIISQQKHPRDFSVSQLQKEWLQNGLLLPNQPQEKLSAQNIVNKLIEGDNKYLFKCCRKAKQDVLPHLRKAYKKNKSILIAKALAWFKDAEGARLIISELELLFTNEVQTGHPQQYFEKYQADNLYWKINQNIALLGMCGNPDSNRIINQILCETHSGGEKVKASDAYNKNRIDLLLIPYYNRILNLCFYIERMPDPLFITGLEQLAADTNIIGYQTSDYNQTRWRLYGGLLELSIATALGRCGSIKGVQTLIKYLQDVHSDFRFFANQELSTILKKDMKFNYDKWTNLVNTEKDFLNRTTPFSKEIEL